MSTATSELSESANRTAVVVLPVVDFFLLNASLVLFQRVTRRRVCPAFIHSESEKRIEHINEDEE